MPENKPKVGEIWYCEAHCCGYETLRGLFVPTSEYVGMCVAWENDALSIDTHIWCVIPIRRIQGAE